MVMDVPQRAELLLQIYLVRIGVSVETKEVDIWRTAVAVGDIAILEG